MITIISVNVPLRHDRLRHIKSEFSDKSEFAFSVVHPIKYEKPTESLWITLQHIIKNEVNPDDDFFIFCEDDHQFTKNYSFGFLKECISEAQQLNADILLGGVSWQKTSVCISENLFWVENFSGTQFMVIFKKFYNAILSAQFGEKDTADSKISELTDKKFIIYPSISTQKEFGYSDITPRNNFTGRVDFLFEKTNHISDSLKKKVYDYYLHAKKNLPPDIKFDEITLPVYIINLKERIEGLTRIKGQFADKNEFDINIVEAVKDKNDRLGLWKSIVKAVQLAVENSDDFMILCEDSHVFTEYYNRDQFIANIMHSYYQKADLLWRRVSILATLN